jgi:aminoglycoside 3-N-acetyltransferase I
MMNRAPFEIQTLSIADIATMRQMLVMFGEAFGERETYTASQPSDAYLKDLLSGGTFVAVAATSEGQVVGGLAAYFLRKFEQARTEVYIYDLAVDAAFRRRGIATAMIEALKKIAQAKGAWVIYVQADHGDDAAIALYTRLGVREDVLHFDIPPGDGGA